MAAICLFAQVLNDQSQPLDRRTVGAPKLSIDQMWSNAVWTLKQQRTGPIGAGGIKSEQQSKKLYQMRVAVHWNRKQLIEDILDDKALQEDMRADLQACSTSTPACRAHIHAARNAASAYLLLPDYLSGACAANGARNEAA